MNHVTYRKNNHELEYGYSNSNNSFLKQFLLLNTIEIQYPK